jgi:SPP1 family predicted phage head-tail adaptor
MQIGKLDQRIILESMAEQNQEGQLVQVWTPIETVFGHVLTQRGGESFEAARTSARQTIRVQLRYRSDVDQTWRLKWANQYYNVVFVDRSLRRQGELWLTAEVVGAK